MKVIVRSKFLGRHDKTSTARKRRGHYLATNGNQVKVAVEGIPFPVWVEAKDVTFV